MTIKEIKQTETQDLIYWMIIFCMGEKVTKKEQKEFFHIVYELTNRGVITNDYAFVKRLRGLLRSDGNCLPEAYQDIWD